MVVTAALTVLLGLSVGAQVGCQSTPMTPQEDTTLTAEMNCRFAVVDHLEGSSADKVDIFQGDPLRQGDYMIMTWQATDRLAKGECLLNAADGSLARFIQFKE
jgi:hypothetical protein